MITSTNITNKTTSEQYKGYLYCLWNRMFLSYGSNVFKLGRTSCLESRINNYTTSYIDPSEYKYTTNRVFVNSLQAERLLFFLLRRNRVRKNREFFNLDLEVIIDTMKKIETISDEKIEKMYNKIVRDFCSDRIIENIKDDVHYLECMVSPDLFFEQFRFRPKNPQMYYKFGYVEPEVNDWYTLNYKIIYEDHKEENINDEM